MTNIKNKILKYKNYFENKSTISLNKLSKYEKNIYNSILYSFSTGGKRIRPFIIFFFGTFFKIDKKTLFSIGFSAELTHTYSLIHDDLPSMDNDDFRRGFPTIHKKFNEATAILCGDALQVIAFNNIVNSNYINENKKLSLISLLCDCSGLDGLISGQSLDINMKKNSNIKDIDNMHDLKTGALFKFCFVSLGIIKNFKKPKLNILEKISYDFGKIFQITDDLLDFEGDFLKVGKSVRKDTSKSNIVYKIGKKLSLIKISKYKKSIIDDLVKIGFKQKEIIEIKSFIDFVSSRDN